MSDCCEPNGHVWDKAAMPATVRNAHAHAFRGRQAPRITHHCTKPDMRPPISPETLEALAHRRVQAKLGWYLHVAIYLLMNLGMFAMSVHAFGSRPWSVYPLLGWGLGVVLHGISVFLLGSGSAVRERMVQREREALQHQQDQADRP